MAGGRQGTPGFRPDRLRALRRSAALRQADLAAAAEVSEPEVSRWERGRRVPQVDQVAALARALGVSPHALVDPGQDGEPTLAYLRIGAGLSQQEAGERAGLLRTTYSAIERGETAALSAAHTAALAEAFGVEEELVRVAHAVSRAQFIDRRTGPDTGD